MNESIQQNLGEVGIKVEFEVMEWNVLLASWRAGAKDAASRGAQSTNSSYFSQDPFTALIRHLSPACSPPKGTNWGYYSDPEMDKLARHGDARRSIRGAAGRRCSRRTRSSSTTRCSCSSRTTSTRAR